jgi:hypothetical protein
MHGEWRARQEERRLSLWKDKRLGEICGRQPKFNSLKRGRLVHREGQTQKDVKNEG